MLGLTLGGPQGPGTRPCPGVSHLPGPQPTAPHTPYSRGWHSQGPKSGVSHAHLPGFTAFSL